MHSKHLFSGIIISAVMMLGACATDTTPGTATSDASDTTLNSNVTQAIQGVPGINEGDLSVTTDAGIVTLRGRTQTRAQAQDAIEAARHVPGVEKVDYDISVDEQ